jgi:predicted RNase H-like nuclease
VRILGADLELDATGVPCGGTLAALDADGAVATIRRAATLAEVAAHVAGAAEDEPFLLGVGLPVIVPERPQRARPVEGLVLRRLGHRLPPGGRGAPGGGAAGREALLAALAVAGRPCLPYPDRDRRSSGLAEIHPALVLKALLWEGSAPARETERADREEALRGYAAPAYRKAASRSRASWAERASALDVVLRALDGPDGYDFTAASKALAAAASDGAVEKAGSIFDACLIAGTARRYLETPESCVFLGDRKDGYVILPADALIRRLALRETRPLRPGLFPRGSLRERLGAFGEVQPAGLLDVPGRSQRTEAVFRELPLYEFDNRDEMLWWKHCRHLSGPQLPVEGLQEMTVALGSAVGSASLDAALRLLRSRHRTLSFRFEPPAAWRARVPTRDGRTYPFRVLRAIYETAAAE